MQKTLKPRKVVENLPLYQTDEYFEKCELKLDANENLFGPSKKVLDKISKLSEKNLKFYPCYGELLDALSKLHNLDKENILLSNGCDEAINVIFNTYLEKGDTVVSFAPTFTMPKIYATSTGAKFIEVDYDKKWEFSTKKISSFVDKKTKIIHLTSPNSPTGEMVKKVDVATLCLEYPHCAIVLDVTYSNFSCKNVDYFDLIQKFKNLFIVKSFSKDYALAGLRLGYVASYKNNINNLKKIISPYSVNTVAVVAGLCALEDKNHLEAMKKEITKSRELMTVGLRKLGFFPYKSEGNFILCDFGCKSHFIYKKLLINSVKVRKLNQNGLENCFRVSVPKIKDTEKFLEILSPRNLLVFDLDGVVFDVRNSYRIAIDKTFTHFTNLKLKEEEIQSCKNLGGLNCDWDLTEFLLKKYGIKIKKDKIIEVFQKYFFNPKNEGTKGLIDSEKILIDNYTLLELSKKYDLAVFTGRPKEETYYSLSKFGILKYFNIIITKNDLPEDKQKPHPLGLEVIKKQAIYKKIFYFGDTTDDILCAKSAEVKAVGILPPQEKNPEYAKRLIDKGADLVLNSLCDVLREDEIGK